MTLSLTKILFMKTYNNLWNDLCSLENLELAFKKAKKGKTYKPYVVEFEKDLENNLLQLRYELIFYAYRPKSLKTFIIKDPKTRVISKSDFRDRIIHHALCNIIEPIFEKSFIFDSYANRKNKGTLKAIQRFEHFKRKISRNNTISGFILKADIKHYFDTIDRAILFQIINCKIKDQKVLWLIKIILNNNPSNNGMPLGNLTSQFFANIYLNELDQFVKQKLKIKDYIRYVDDFIIFSNSKYKLTKLKNLINLFINKNLNLQLHPEKSQILSIEQGIPFLGFRIFEHHKLLKKSNLRKCKKRLAMQELLFKQDLIKFDKIYNSYLGWKGYAQQANTYNLTARISKHFQIVYENEYYF